MSDPSPRRRERTNRIRNFVLRSVSKHSEQIAVRTATEFEISISSANAHIKNLVDEGLLLARGKTRARKYTLGVLEEDQLTLDLTPSTDESAVWDRWLAQKLAGDLQNVRSICQHGFTEILNNAIDHSDSPSAQLRFLRTPVSIQLTVSDFGIGIFRKIAEALSLESHQQSLLELAKGKLTTDPARHSGEGIFFTSRMFDEFEIFSDSLFFSHDPETGTDWLLERPPVTYGRGTHVFMTIDREAEQTPTEIFDRFTNDFKDFGFTKTHVPVRMMLHEGDRLVSRSQARRLLSRVDRFEEVMLDFEGVEEVGQAFADEIFRVFARAHPDIRLIPVSTPEKIQQMIRRAQQKPESPGL